MAGKGTTHHRIHGVTGLVTILSLPFVLCGLLCAIPGHAEGFTSWISAPFGAISLLIFLSGAVWYCKLEFDEVIMDYFDGGLRSFSLLANKLVGFLVWAASAYVIITMWLGA